MITDTIPYGWRKLIPGDIQRDDDWYYDKENWNINLPGDVGCLLNDSRFTMIRRTSGEVDYNPNYSRRVDTLVKENERLTRENNRISIELIDKTNELNNLRKSLRALV